MIAFIPVIIAAFIMRLAMRKFFPDSRVASVVMGYIIFGFVSSMLFFALSQSQWYAFRTQDIKNEPLFYLFILFVVATMPFLFLKTERLRYVDDFGVTKIWKILAVVIVTLSIFPFFEGLYRALTSSASSLADAYEGVSVKYSFFTDFCLRSRRYFAFLIIPLFFYFLYKGPCYKRYSHMMLFCFATTMILDFASGARGMAINDLNYFIFFFIAFKSLLTKELYKKLKKISVVALIIICIGVFTITLARFTDGGRLAVGSNRQMDLVTWVVLYAGQGPCEFSRQMYPSTVRTMGDNSFSLVKTFLGMNTFKDNNERREYWKTKQKIQNYIFYTVIGDVYSDLGWHWTIVFFVVLSLFMSIYFYRCSRRCIIKLQHLVLGSIYFEWITMGFMTNCYKVYYIQFYIFMTIALMFGITIYQKTIKKDNFNSDNEGL